MAKYKRLGRNDKCACGSGIKFISLRIGEFYELGKTFYKL